MPRAPPIENGTAAKVMPGMEKSVTSAVRTNSESVPGMAVKFICLSAPEFAIVAPSAVMFRQSWLSSVMLTCTIKLS